MLYLRIQVAIVLSIVLTASFLRAEERPRIVKQGAELLKTDIMGVFAHPDDETGMAGTLAMYALAREKVVANVYCTRGEGGGNMVGTQWGPALGILREAELRQCLDQIGVRYCYFLDQRDFFYTESVAATLQKWDRPKTLESLVRFIRTLRPDVIVTMDPTPRPGQHGHHQAAGILAVEAFDIAADPNQFPGQLKDEGLKAWQVRKLYFGGGEPGHSASILIGDTLPDGRTPAQIAGRALASHRSQGFGNFRNSPRTPRPQFFRLAKSVVPFEESETDLLRGLAIADESPKPVHRLMTVETDAPLKIEFVPRPAIANYRKWAKLHEVDHLLTRFASDVPVIAGEPNTMEIIVHNSQAKVAEGEIQIQTTEDWAIEPKLLKYRVQAGQTESIHFSLTPKIGALKDAKLTATMLVGNETVSASAIAHPLPFTHIARIPSAPAMDGSSTGWEPMATHEIPPTNVAEGTVKDAADSSAHFRIAHDGNNLYFDVDVTDDVVVSNIAPDDIRGHWRSDAVEICIDPVGGAEHTLGCFKVGIFPFDTTGVVRAARDADARQGPIEQTAPGMRVASVRTPTGYRIQATIPFSEIGFDYTKGKRLGFNLIVYDGDKRTAAIGENINKSRIAWSPRPGVQGRPEDWGRVELE